VGLNVRRFAPSVHQDDAANGFGDIEMFPLMLGWKDGDLKWQGQFAVYAPSGSCKKGDLANIGRNYWTFEPSGAVSYLSSRFGLEVTAFAGFDFNTMNDATDYRTGNQFHLDGAIAEHLPLFGGFVGAGVNGYFYQQITGDSGSGAKLGGFEGMTAGIGPDLLLRIPDRRVRSRRRSEVAAGTGSVEQARRQHRVAQARGELGTETAGPA
jgi:hypothetical protein